MTSTNTTVDATQYVIANDQDMHNTLAAVHELGYFGGVTIDNNGVWRLELNLSRVDGTFDNHVAAIGNTITVISSPSGPMAWVQ